MELLPIVKAFMRLWFGFFFLFGPIGIIAAISSRTLESLMFVAISIVMFGFGCALTHGAFRFEVPKTKEALLKLIDGREEISEQSPGHVRK